MGWILGEERDTISADNQDFALRVFVGPPREQVIHGKLQEGSPLDLSGATKLAAIAGVSDTTITVESTAGFPASGAFFVDTEFIKYGSKTSTTFTNLTRINPATHDNATPVYQFKEVTDRVMQISLSGSIDQHEWTGTFQGDTYDWRLFQPDRSVYVEYRYFPQYGSPGPSSGDGLTDVTGMAVTELFTLKDSSGTTVYPRGMTWTTDGHLWVVTDDDQIIRVDPTSGEVQLTLSPSQSITNIEGITSGAIDSLWIATASPTGVSTIYQVDRWSGIVTSTFTVPFQATGITWDGTNLWIMSLLTLGIYKYSTAGALQSQINAPDESPGALAYWDGSLWATGQDRIYRVNPTTGAVESMHVIPPYIASHTWYGMFGVLTYSDETTALNVKGLALSTIGGRIGDGTSGKVYRVQIAPQVGRSGDTSTGGWSGWLPLYFGYIEEGSIQADYLEKTWSFTTRSTWMYFGDKEADGRNLAPSAISDFKPTRCSSVLSDPAVEIGNEYISSPGEGVGCGNIVDDDMTTVWISQNVPWMSVGHDPTPDPEYGCIGKPKATGQLNNALNPGDTKIFIDGFFKWIEFPVPGGMWIYDAGNYSDPRDDPNGEWVWYLEKVIDPTLGHGFTNLVNSLSDHTPKTIQNSHVRFEKLDGTYQCPAAREACPNAGTTGWACCDPGTSGNPNPYYVTYRETGRQFPLLPGDDTGASGNKARRLVFTEIYKPRLGLRPEHNWWIEMRNISNRDHANLMGNDVWAPWHYGQGFLVMQFNDVNGTPKSVNVPLSMLRTEHITIGPWADPTGGKSPTCEKGWLVIVGDRTEFNRWWGVPVNEAVTVLDFRYITENFPDTLGNPANVDFTNGQLKYYWLNAWPDYIDSAGSQVITSITPTDTQIHVENIDLYPDHGFGMIMIKTRQVKGEATWQPYEWIEWTDRTDINGGTPSGGTEQGYLTGVSRGVEGTKAREWTGGEPYRSDPRYPQPPTINTNYAQVVVFYDLGNASSISNPTKPDGTLETGGSLMKLSDWVRFDDFIPGYQGRLPRIKHGHALARFSDRDWAWIDKKVPQPGTKLRTGVPEWFSVDLGEITPPKLYLNHGATDSVIQMRSDTSDLANSGVVQIDQEWIKYDSINRDASAVAPHVHAQLEGLTRGYDGTSAAAHDDNAQVWQVIDRHALVEHLVSGVSWHRKADAPDGVPAYYRIYMTWRPTPRYPDTSGWENDWDLIWSVSGNTQRNRGHFIQAFADLDSGADSSRPPGTLDYHAARHVMMVIDQTNNGRAKMNEFKVYGTNPRVNLLAGSLDREDEDDDKVSELQNSIAVFFDYVIRGFGLSPDEVKVMGTGVNFYELPIASGPYTSILSELADKTGYAIWFNRFNQLWFTPDPSTRRSMPVMTDLDASLMRGPIQILAKPSGRVSQVIIYFRDDLSDETVEVRYPEQPRELGSPLKFDNVVIASGEEAKDIARQIYQEANGQWEVSAKFGIAPHFMLGHRYTVTYSDWEASGTYFQGANFIVSAINFDITTGPDRRWDTSVTLTEYHITV